MPGPSKIILEYKIAENEIQRFDQIIAAGLTPSIAIGKAPIAELVFIINGFDFSRYHKADSRTPVLEFAIDLLTALQSGRAGHLLEIGHLDGPGFLYLVKQSDNELLIQHPDDDNEFVEISTAALLIEAEKFCSRLYQELFDRSSKFRELIKTDSGFSQLMGVLR